MKLKSVFAIIWNWNSNKFLFTVVFFLHSTLASVFVLFYFRFVFFFFLGTCIFYSFLRFSSWFHTSSKCCCKICYIILWNLWNKCLNFTDTFMWVGYKHFSLTLRTICSSCSGINIFRGLRVWVLQSFSGREATYFGYGHGQVRWTINSFDLKRFWFI